MKNRNIFFMLIWMCSSTLLFAQELFKEYHPNIDTYNEIIKNVNNINLSGYNILTGLSSRHRMLVWHHG